MIEISNKYAVACIIFVLCIGIICGSLLSVRDEPVKTTQKVEERIDKLERKIMCLESRVYKPVW